MDVERSLTHMRFDTEVNLIPSIFKDVRFCAQYNFWLCPLQVSLIFVWLCLFASFNVEKVLQKLNSMFF